MKILTSFLLVSVLSFFSLGAYSQITDVTLEPYMVHTGLYDDGVDLTGFTTWRVYVHFQNPSDFLSAVYGLEGEDDIFISTTTSFFQHELAGFTANNNNCVFWDVAPSMQWDSFVTIQKQSSCETDDLFFVSTNPIPNEVEYGFEGAINGDYFDGGDVFVEDGTWFTLNDGENGLAGDDLRVLVAQLTTDGDVTFCASFQGFVMGDGTNLSDVTVCLDSNAWGCTDTAACNYNPNIDEDVDVCVYSPSVVGVVFQDDNLDGVFDIQNFEEMGMPNVAVTLNELGWMTFTDVMGNFEFTNVPEGDYTLTIGLPNESWMLTSGNEISVAVGPCVNQLDNIGVVEGWGCTDSTSCNYNSNADVDYDSCVYEASLSGIVFFDANSDGLFTPFSSLEYPLENFQVTLNELDLIAYTDANGSFMFPGIPEGDYTLTFGNVSENWVLTTTLDAVTSVGPCYNEVGDIGVLPEGESAFWVAGLSNMLMPDLHCTDGMDVGLFIQNLGGSPLNGTLTLTFDPLLVSEIGTGNIVNPDLLNSGEVIWNLDNTPNPGELLVFSCHIQGPGVDYFGDEFPMTMHLSLVDDLGAEFYSNSWNFVPTVVCSYDPNDKYTEYPGYTNEHFVLADDEIEYRIRFQNIGNYPAMYVAIQDTIDTDLLDLSTFYPVLSSHSMMTCVQPNGVVDFIFDNINLPDSTSNEPESHGFVAYRIKPKSTVQPGDVINNTAYITFDQNPTMATNTTWHTIIECGNEAMFDPSSLEYCDGEEIVLIANSPYADSVAWSVDGTLISSDQNLSLDMGVGVFDISLTASNELCVDSSIVVVEGFALPDTVLTFPETGGVLAADGFAWQWYLNGTPIEGATLQLFNEANSGVYSVEVTNEAGCSIMSEEFVVLSVEKDQPLGLQLYPNPMTEFSTLLIPDGIGSVELTIFDSRGRVVRAPQQLTSGSFRIDKEGWSSGLYGLQIRTASMVHTMTLMVK